MIHSTPKRRKRKAFFQSFPDKTKIIYQRTREDETQPANRGEEGVQAAADPGAEEEEVPGRAQEEGGGEVEPHPPVLQPRGGEEEGQADQKPEGQVQQLPEGAVGGGAADQAEQVIAQAQAQPQPQADQEGPGLGKRVEAHPRKRRPRKPPPRASSSS